MLNVLVQAITEKNVSEMTYFCIESIWVGQ